MLYGGGLRLLEALRLRVKDVDFARRQLLVRSPKGGRDRGAPLPQVAEGPLRVAGTPSMTGTMYAAGVNNRAFYALAVGTNPLDAKILQNNMLPVNELEPVAGEKRRIALPSVAARVPEGQNLYVLVSAASDTFVSMGSRTPGAIVLEGVKVRLPVVG